MTDTLNAADVFTKLDIKLMPDPSRTVIRPFGFDYPAAFAAGRPPRSEAVAARLMALDPAYRRRMLTLLRRAGLLAVNRMGGLKSVFVSEAAGISGNLPRLLRGEKV